MSSLIDSNILVYRFDPRDRQKQEAAATLLRKLVETGDAHIAHQSIVEFVLATTRPLAKAGACLLEPEEAAWEAEELLRQFIVLYPCEQQVRLGIRGWRTYGMSWLDSHLWSFAEYYQLPTLYSEDFQNRRCYGTVRVINPFLAEDDE